MTFYCNKQIKSDLLLLAEEWKGLKPQYSIKSLQRDVTECPAILVPLHILLYSLFLAFYFIYSLRTPRIFFIHLVCSYYFFILLTKFSFCHNSIFWYHKLFIFISPKLFSSIFRGFFYLQSCTGLPLCSLSTFSSFIIPHCFFEFFSPLSTLRLTFFISYIGLLFLFFALALVLLIFLYFDFSSKEIVIYWI